MLRQAMVKLGIVPLFLLVLMFTARPPCPVETEPEVAYFEVKIDGLTVGVICEGVVAEFERSIETTVLSEVARLGRDAQVVQRISLNRTANPPQQSDPLGKVLDELAARIEVMASAVAILVDNQPVVVVANEETAEGILDEMLSEYELQLLDIVRRERGDVRSFSIETVGVEQSVTIRPGLFEPARIASREQALAILQRGTDEERTYTVAQGETLWGIARSHDLSIEELVAANPRLSNPNLLRPGDELSLVVPVPFISVTSSEQITYARPITFGTQVVYDSNLWPWERVVRQSGRNGERLITVRTHRIDGKLIEAETIDDTVVEEPRVQILAQGSRQIPSLGTGLMVWPTEGRISSPFGWRRGGFHQGVDIAAPTGTPVRAADAGVVTTSGWQGLYGNLIVIDHGGGKIVTYYAHLSRRIVSVGARVTKGQIIGHVGSTGRSTGPHLHFEVRINGTPVDPVKYYQETVGK